MNWEKTFQTIFIPVALVAVFLTFSRIINLTNSDIGRHITNGRIVLEDRSVLKKNYYSYTEPEYETINHHWLSGVTFFIVWKYFSFTGLAVFSALISTLTIAIIFLQIKKSTNFFVAAAFTLFALPVIASRTEIRPETFSYLLIAIYLVILNNVVKNGLKTKYMLLLGALQILWVNLHIFFIFGNFLVGAFTIYFIISRAEKRQITRMTLLTISLFIMNIVNPHGLVGAFTPLTIFQDFGYMLAENQSLLFMHKRKPNSIYVHFIVMLLVLGELLLFNTDKEFKKENLHTILITTVFAILGLNSIRLFPLFGIMFPILGGQIIYSSQKSSKNTLLAIVTGSLLLIGYIIPNHYLSFRKLNTGWGLNKRGQNSAQFFLDNDIQGPIFNNYDIGSYLIFEIFPEHRVFVDNRPEAYSVEFFEEVYVPAQQKNGIWDEVAQEYNFNAIYFYRHDFTPWGQNFLIDRYKDPNWIPVYVDEYTIIFLRDNETNQELIQKYRLPDHIFTVVKNT